MNTDRFKFRVWDEEKRKYHSGAFGLSPSGELLVEWVMGFIKYPDPYVIEQCTGLKDRNGKLIYEGDVLEYTYSDGSKRQWFIVFDENLLQFSQCLISEDKTFPFSGINKEIALKKEIVGNIHEPKWGIESEVE